MRAGVSCRRAIGVTAIALALGGATAQAQRLDWMRRVWSGPDREDPYSAYRSASAPALATLAGGDAIVAVKGGIPSRRRSSFDPLWQVLRFPGLASPPGDATWELPDDALGPDDRPFGVPAAVAATVSATLTIARQSLLSDGVGTRR